MQDVLTSSVANDTVGKNIGEDMDHEVGCDALPALPRVARGGVLREAGGPGTSRVGDTDADKRCDPHRTTAETCTKPYLKSCLKPISNYNLPPHLRTQVPLNMDLNINTGTTFQDGDDKYISASEAAARISHDSDSEPESVDSWWGTGNTSSESCSDNEKEEKEDQ